MTIDWIAVLVAGVAGFLVGAVWYSPVLFAKAWQREAGVSDEKLKSGNMGLIFGGALVLAIVSALVFHLFLGANPGLKFATSAGLAAGLFWVAASFGINYLFERRSLKLFLINGGYHTLEFTAIGAVLGWLG